MLICNNCKHVENDMFEEPCVDCFGHSKFEPNEEKEKEKKTMDRRTKVQLLEAIEEKDAEIKDLKEEIKNLEKYEEYRKWANEVKVIHASMVDAGFTDWQAFELLKAMIPAALAQTNNRSRSF